MSVYKVDLAKKGVLRLSGRREDLDRLHVALKDGIPENIEEEDMNSLMGVLKEHYKTMNILGGENLAKAIIAFGDTFKDVDSSKIPDDKKDEILERL